jgi:hypothetical protein
MDIAPLVDKAFPVSFGNKKSVIKAIDHRGWNPLNYNLLTEVCNKKDVIDLTDAEILKPTCSLNISNGTSNHYLDLLIEEEIKKWRKKEEV